MTTEFDNSLHWGLFLTGTTLTSETGKYVRVSELVLSALRATGVFSNMVDGIVAPDTDRLWLDKNYDPAVLKEWDATGASWVPMTYGRLFGRAAVDKLTVTGGTGNAIVVSQPVGFQASRLYLMTPTANNSGAATINVSGVGTYVVKYGDGADISATEFMAGRQTVLFFTGARFEVLFPLAILSAAVVAAQGSASAAAASALLSQKYAANPEDVEVEPGLFSSRHYLAKVVAYWSLITNTLAGWIHGAAAKATPVDADEFGYADSAASWSLKKLTWAQVKAAIGIGTDQRLAAKQSGGVLDCNNATDTGFYFCVSGTAANIPVAASGYLQVLQQSDTAPDSRATKQIYYVANDHRTFTRYRWYSVAGAWGAWVETTSFGRQTASMRADEFVPRITNGASIGIRVVATSTIPLLTLNFDTSVQESAVVAWVPPKSWNEGEVSFEVLWTGAAAGAGGVVFGVSACAFGDGDTLQTGLSGGSTVTDVYLGADLEHRTPESTSFVIGGAPAEMDVVYFAIRRVVADAADTLAQDAQLIGVRLFYTTNAGTDA